MYMSEVELSDVSKTTVHILDFEFADVYGKIIYLYGLHMTVAIVVRKHRDITDC